MEKKFTEQDLIRAIKLSRLGEAQFDALTDESTIDFKLTEMEVVEAIVDKKHVFVEHMEVQIDFQCFRRHGDGMEVLIYQPHDDKDTFLVIINKETFEGCRIMTSSQISEEFNIVVKP